MSRTTRATLSALQALPAAGRPGLFPKEMSILHVVPESSAAVISFLAWERREERGMSHAEKLRIDELVARLGARDGELASRTERPRDMPRDDRSSRSGGSRPTGEGH